MVFGRTGQMFPRRAYHDAIYEEEYGSETEEECCRGRGLSAILCWFLSVIILVGLAASVVLTVFFILRSRSLIAKNNPEDLNVVFDHGNGFIVPTTSTTDLNFDFTSSSKIPLGSEEVQTIISTARTTTATTTTTTKLPTTSRMTTRKYYSDTTGRSQPPQYSQYDSAERTTPMPATTNSNSMFKFLFDTIKTFQKDDFPRSSETVDKPKRPLEEEEEPEDEIISNESVEHDNYAQRRTTTPVLSTTTTARRPSSSSSINYEGVGTTPRTVTSTSPVLFTLPPSTSTISQNTNNRRNPGTTRFPERTSFSSEEITSTTYQQYDHSKHYIPTSQVEKELLDAPSSSVGTTEKTQTTIDEPEEEEKVVDGSSSRKGGAKGDEINYQTDESKKLTNMLIDQIPPHDNNDDENTKYSKLTTTTSPPPTTLVTQDLLAKIIKNLQPKWSKGKTVTATTTTIGETTTNKYNNEYAGSGSSSVTSRVRNRYVDKENDGNSSTSKENNSNYSGNGHGGSYVKVKRVKYRVTTTLPPPSTIIIITPDNSVTTEMPTTLLSSSSSSTASSSSSSSSSPSMTTTSRASTRHYNSIPSRHSHSSSNKIDQASSSFSSSGNTKAPIEIVKGPDFSGNRHNSNHYNNNNKNNNNDIKQRQKEHDEYLDILVGNDDHKTLVTKETDAGIITSAILPPWFDTNGNSTDTLELTNRTMKFTKTISNPALDDSKNDHSKPKSDIDILLNLFSNSPLPSKKPTSNRTGGMTTGSFATDNNNSMDKKGHAHHHHHEMTVEETKKSQHLKNLEEQLKPFFSSPSDTPDDDNDDNTDNNNKNNSPKNVSPANNVFHFGSSDGTTNIYGYYPDEDLDEGESADQLDIDIGGKDGGGQRHGKKQNNPNKNDRNNNEDPLNTSQSNNHHVSVDIAYDPKTRPEIVIEPDVGGEEGVEEEEESSDGEEEYLDSNDNNNYPDLIEPMSAAGSDAQNHPVFLPPPENLRKIDHRIDISNNNNNNDNSTNAITGGGIRRPMSSEEKEDEDDDNKNNGGHDQISAGNNPESQKSDWSMKAPSSSSSSNVNINGDENNNHANHDREIENKPQIILPEKGTVGDDIDEDFSEEEQGDELDDRILESNGNEQLNERNLSQQVKKEQQQQQQQEQQEQEKQELLGGLGENQNQIVERKPILDVHESLYPSKEDPRVKVNSPGSLSSVSTTVQPNRVRVYEVYSEPYRPSSSTEAIASSSSTEKPNLALEDPTENITNNNNNNNNEDDSSSSSSNNSNSSGFIPPTPLNFHDNTYTFNSQTSSEYVSKDGWRPVLYDRERDRQRDANQKNQNSLNVNHQQQQAGTSLTSSMQPPVYQNTPGGITSSTIASVNAEGASAFPSENLQQDDYEDEEENPGSNEHWYSESPPGISPDSNNSKPRLKIKPSMPLPPMSAHQHNNINTNTNSNNIPPISRVKFPGNDQQPQQSIMHHHHTQQPPPQQQHHSQQQQQQQQSNNIIDRSKYLHRPASPPIIMRRTPQFTFPFTSPNRKRNTKPPPPPPPSHHRRGPQFHPPPPNGPFNHPPPPDNNNNSNNNNNNQILRHRFKNQNTKPPPPPTAGSVHWPGDDNFTRRNNPVPVNRRRIGY